MFTKRNSVLFISYIIVTFILAYIWHLVIFGSAYAELGIASLRPEPIFQFGLLAIIVHAAVFTYFFAQFFDPQPNLARALKLSLGLGAVITAYAALSVPAKFEIEPASHYVWLELVFGVIHYSVIGVLYYFLAKRGITQ